jgi:hypothetical protein
MANPEHLEILKQGVEQWNKWRNEHPDVAPELNEAELTSIDLRNANLRRANLLRANLHDADLKQANLRKTKLALANLVRVDLRGADLRGADLSMADLRRGNVRGANLGDASLRRTNLRGANLQGAHLSEADLSGADLYGANVRQANLRTANLGDADLRRANLGGADLYQVDLSGSGVNGTIFADVDLSFAKGLETVKHHGPSTIGIDTIYKSRGRIPEAFLRGCGVPDEFIAYISSMVGRPIEFYSCFISYSSRDQEFAERLHADLQAKGVRCWFAPEDLKIGDKFQDRIEESIRYHDKLLLVLSENSIQSPWVEREVQAAFEREQRSNKLVLFPIRLDEAVMETPKAWAADIRRTRHIGEFNRWPDHDSYKRALERLLRDLKAESPA